MEEIIKDLNEKKELTDGNQIIGLPKEFNNSTIEFKGENNILYIADDVVLKNCTIGFYGSNSLIYLSKDSMDYKIDISVFNDSVAYFDQNSYFNQPVKIILSERTNFFAGRNCLFSSGISARTGDPHLIYSTKNYKRLNVSKSIYLGDHVWIGQDAILLKNAKIYSGSIIGAKALVSSRPIGSNEVWGGNPPKRLKKNIFWNGSCVHSWNKHKTKKSLDYRTFKDNEEVDEFIYTYTKDEYLSFDTIEKKLTSLDNASKKMDYLNKLTYNKNRFAYNPNTRIIKLKKFVKKNLQRVKKVLHIKK